MGSPKPSYLLTRHSALCYPTRKIIILQALVLPQYFHVGSLRQVTNLVPLPYGFDSLLKSISSKCPSHSKVTEVLVLSRHRVFRSGGNPLMMQGLYLGQIVQPRATFSPQWMNIEVKVTDFHICLLSVFFIWRIKEGRLKIRREKRGGGKDLSVD